jgi:hypothetical protein
MADRIPCINPNCLRTADASKYQEGVEIICGKCFRALPDELRKAHQRFWREMRKWDRRIARTSDEIKLQQMHDIRDKWAHRIHANWKIIKSYFTDQPAPAGIENFMKEIGLGGSS